MNTRSVLLAGLLLAFPAISNAQDARGFYFSTNIGLTSASETDVTFSGPNHPTRCDLLLYANPANAPSDAICAAPPTEGDLGFFAFDRDTGTTQSLALGYAMGSLRLEAEVLLRRQVGSATPLQVGSDAAIVSKNTEWSALAPPNADIYNFRSVQAFANVYFDFHNASAWTPYLGAGAGLGTLTFGLYSSFQRKSIDEGYLEVYGGSKSNPEAAPEWQRAAAGTSSLIDEQVSKAAFGYQLLGGIDRSLGNRTTLGLKVRWAGIGNFSTSLPWTLIRSHRPVHADGRTPFFSSFGFDPMGYLGAALEMRYRF